MPKICIDAGHCVTKPHGTKSVRIDMIGKRFGRWTVLEYVRNDKWGKPRYLCRCDCGNEAIITGESLRIKSSKSCGCLQREITSKRNFKHGFKNNLVYGIWKHMNQRCRNPNSRDYKWYGGRGIKICEEWKDPIEFVKWAYANGYKKGLTIDRKNGDGDYNPDNCRWITIGEQQRNKTNNIIIRFNGVTKTLPEWAEFFGIKRDTLKSRYYRGFKGEKLFKKVI